jgi:Tol biopolymer transport system component
VFTSTRSGANEIWVCRSDGSDAVQLTTVGNAGAAKWSPDGRTIVYREAGAARTSICVISADGGAPRRLTAGPFRDKLATFSRDGKSIYFASHRSGWCEIWKVPAGGGDPVQVTPNGEVRDLPQESLDGKFIYYTKIATYPKSYSVWRMPVGGGEETLVLDSVHWAALWALWKEGIYFFRPADEKGRSDICLYEFATGRTRRVLTIEKPIDSYIEASPDGRTILYTQLDQAGSDLMLVENFR